MFILVIVLAMVSGCTQQAQPAAIITPASTPVVTPAATAIPTIPPTTEAIPLPTTEPTTVVTTPPSTNATATTPVPVGTASTKITTIHIVNNTFVPQQLTILPGTGITWINDDLTPHAIKTTGNQAVRFNSGDFMKGVDWGYTFGANEGTFEIIDTYSNSTSIIIVKKGELLSSSTTVRPTTTA